MPYYDNFWHKDAHEYPTPCLIHIHCKVENWDLSDLNRRLIETWLGIQQSVIDQAINQLVWWLMVMTVTCWPKSPNLAYA